MTRKPDTDFPTREERLKAATDRLEAGIGELFSSDRYTTYLQAIRRQINPKLKIGGVFLTMANETNFRRDIVSTVKMNFGKHLPVLDTVIPATVRLAEISTADKSIFQHEPRGRAADAYRRLTKEVLEIGKKERSRSTDLGR